MKILFYLSVSALLLSCAGYKASMTDNEIETVCQDSFVTLADLYDHAEMIPLENKEEAMICDVLKMEVTPEGFFIRDLYGGGFTRILFFDNKGNFVTQIGKMGKSKQEYIYIDDMAVDKAKKEVAILTMGQQIKRYDYDGKYKDEILLQDDVRYETLCYSDDMYICSTWNNDKQDSLICIFNHKGEVISKHVASLPKYIHEGQHISNPIQADGNKVLYADYYRSKFHLIDLKNPLQESSYNMDIDNMFVYTDDSSITDKGDKDDITSSYYMNDAIFGLMNHKRSLSYYQIDLKRNKACVCPFYDWTPMLFTMTDGYAYAVLTQAEVMSLCVRKSPYTNQTKDMLGEAFKAYANNFTMKDNFVILKMKPKDINLFNRK